MAERIPLSDQIECVQRELRQRARVYPRLVDSGRMTQAQADREMVRMRAVEATLVEAAAKEQLL